MSHNQGCGAALCFSRLRLLIFMSKRLRLPLDFSPSCSDSRYFFQAAPAPTSSGSGSWFFSSSSGSWVLQADLASQPWPPTFVLKGWACSIHSVHTLATMIKRFVHLPWGGRLRALDASRDRSLWWWPLGCAGPIQCCPASNLLNNNYYILFFFL